MMIKNQKPYKYIENDKSKTILLKLTSAQALYTDYQDLKPEGWFIFFLNMGLFIMFYSKKIGTVKNNDGR